MFRVVPDQLKISDGWVRCGHCADVFDATLHLETWVPPAPAAEGAGPSAPAPPPSPVAATSAQAGLAGRDVDSAVSTAASSPRPDRFIRREQRTQVGVPPGVPGGITPPMGGAGQRRPPSEPSVARPPTQGLRAEGLIKPSAGDGDKFDVTVPAPLERGRVTTNERVRPSPVGGSSQTKAAVPSRSAPAPTMVGPSDPPMASGAVRNHTDAGDVDFLTELQRFASKASGDEPKADVKQPEFRLKRSMVKAKGQETPAAAPPSPPDEPSPPADEREVTVAPQAVKADVQPTQVAVEEARKPEPVEKVESLQEAAVAPPPAEPEFIQQARRRAYWQTPAMRALLSGAVLVLAGLLITQWAIFERNRLVAWKPGLQPTFQALCGALGCTLAPVQRIDAIVIDSTALVRRLGNFYSFDLVLKNTAPISVAVPALELSLTDAGDNVISRRVFLPQDLPAVPDLLAAGSSLSVSLRLSIAVGDSLPMAGYRALVFYP